MNKKSILSLWLCLCLLLSGCQAGDPIMPEAPPANFSSGEQTTVEKPSPANQIYRFYYDSADSFHPFEIRTQTQYYLMSLLYDGLVKVSPEYTLEYRIADAVSIDAESREYSIRLTGKKFSDGSKITPQDVVYSFEQAKREGSLYAGGLKDAERCEINGKNGVVITLSKANRFFAYNLDFPILKKGSDGRMPIGCGRYILKKSGNAYRMEPNAFYSFPEGKKLPDIELSVLKSNDSMLYAVKTGAITAYADKSGGGGSAAVGTWMTSVSLNHLVFVGINPKRPILSMPEVRKAMLLAIDSSAVLAKAYGSQGVIASTPLNPRLTDNMSYDFSGQELYDLEQAKQLLENAGYRTAATNVREDKKGKPLTVSLLVNKNNSSRYSAAYLIAGMLESVGFAVNLERVPYDEYEERIVSGNFDLYLGETSQPLSCSMDIFLTGAASYGIGKEGTLSFAPLAEKFLKSERGEQEFFDTFFEEVPMIPLLYRNGWMIYSKSIENKVKPAPHDMFYNIEDWQ